MTVLDSSSWIEVFTDGPNAAVYLPALRRPAEVIVPAICLFEVARYFLRNSTEQNATRAVAQMRLATVAHLDEKIALTAARTSVRWKIPAVDSIILATAQTHDAELWTQDADFEGVPGVKYIPKKS
jgi:toxin FitB